MQPPLDAAPSDRTPWEVLEQLLADGRTEQLRDFLTTLRGGDAVLAISRLPEDRQTRLFTLLQPDDAADLVEQMPEAAPWSPCRSAASCRCCSNGSAGTRRSRLARS